MYINTKGLQVNRETLIVHKTVSIASEKLLNLPKVGNITIVKFANIICRVFEYIFHLKYQYVDQRYDNVKTCSSTRGQLQQLEKKYYCNN